MAHDQPETRQLTDVPPAGYRSDSPLARGRVWLPLVALAALAAYAAADYGWRGDRRYTPGALAQVHATWDNQCVRCHVDAQPLGGKNWAAAAIGDTHAADDRCSSCHAGPAHHTREKAADVPGCAACHHEHQGRRATLTQVSDSLCTNCHQDLQRHFHDGVPPNEQTVFSVVTRFTEEQHPEFWVTRPRVDPGTVRFNHKLHLTPGLTRVDKPVAPFELADVAPAFRERFAAWTLQPTNVIHLNCDACHRTDAEGFRTVGAALDDVPHNAVLPARGDGAYMQPIVYEKHCQACHPLTIDRAVADQPRSGRFKVPHRARFTQLAEAARGYYTDQFLQGKLGVQPNLLTRPLPGKNPARATVTAREAIDQRVTADLALLRGTNTCQKCHASLATIAEVEPAQIPQVWFTRAKFAHATHRPVATCEQCHTSARGSEFNSDVLLPERATCHQCHAPSHRAADSVGGGARFNCVECHRYHDGDHPLHGRGAR